MNKYNLPFSERWLPIALCILLLVASLWPGTSVLPVVAQEGLELTYGLAVEGSIAQASSRVVYYFQARRGDVVALTATVLDGNLDPVLVLADNTGHVLATSDDAGVLSQAVIPSFQITADDFYFVIVTRFGHALGSTQGTFALQLERVGVLSEAGVFLNYGDSIVGDVSGQNSYVSYIFEAERGDIINIGMQRISGNLDSRLIVKDANGQIVAENDDWQGGLDAAVENLLILEPGEYQILATRFGEEAGDTEGSFVLSLDTAPTSGQALTADSALLLHYGEVTTGSVDAEASGRYYTFGAKRGDIITITLNRTSGDLDPLVVLLDPRQQPLQEDDDSGPSNNALLESFIIPETGTYFILATRFDKEAGRTTGGFSIQLDGISGEAPVVAPGTLTILYNSSVNGMIDDATAVVSYAFLGHAGDVITIALDKTSGDLDPALLLYSAESVQLASDDDSGSEKNALISAYRLPADGIYYILASRFEFQSGKTSGGYRLSLTQIPPEESESE